MVRGRRDARSRRTRPRRLRRSDVTAPRPLAGHSFSAWLSCPQKAFLSFHGNRAERALDPPHLIALQQQGNAHERDVCARLYPDAITIPERASPSERRRATLAAMRAGQPAILQGYLGGGDDVGIADVLEHVRADASSPTGHVYRIGEFKRSFTLKTGHALQAAWYTELLARQQGTSTGDAVFVLGDGERRLVDLRPVMVTLQQVRDALRALRGGAPEPGPRLCTACPSCPWRLRCMPQLVARADVSLVPGIGVRRADALLQRGIDSWREIPVDGGDVLADLGMAAYEIERARAALRALRAGRPVFKAALRRAALLAIVPASIEFEVAPDSARAEERPQPTAVLYQGREALQRINIALTADGKATADLAGLAGARIGMYGGTDRHALFRLARASGMRRPPVVDVLDIVQSYVHFPVVGLGLDVVAAHAEGREDLMPLRDARDRVEAIGSVLRWLASHTADAA